ncbi:related to Elongator complex protein 5 [Saccharomycodes ludwigii]|uniref:Elongator complex protein 5 n=1 Tax=Saccharomycodes ludwigii TaxID=36035 RepID=A0A376B4Z9_9ASCO|nr:hypothetical protein SCDLUD_004741 [Saccharomycodes ludwigii]KAH3899304.1 hypothetical protein SCDLUD_004741 [Saccharomycodes ludwigii]SSD59659.1 related to Elongator complex protein 5 [Saccharomycodes ludwigii]
MASTTHNPTVLLKRLFSLKDTSPLYLIIDSMAQTAQTSVLHEIAFHTKNNTHNAKNNVKIIYISFETSNTPSYCDEFIDASRFTSTKELLHVLNSVLENGKKETTDIYRILLIVDSINYINNTEITEFIQAIFSPHTTLCVVYHKDIDENENHTNNPLYHQKHMQSYYPNTLKLLKYIATNIFETFPNLDTNKYVADEEELEACLNDKFIVPRGLNNYQSYNLTLTNKRKSGRSLIFEFVIDSKTHSYINYSDYVRDRKQDRATISDTSMNNQDMFNGLTTFNLNISDKQKRAKEQVELPYLEAQNFNSGGAIVYEFEKDDDYDEEDPYEDPF